MRGRWVLDASPRESNKPLTPGTPRPHATPGTPAPTAAAAPVALAQAGPDEDWIAKYPSGLGNLFGDRNARYEPDLHVSVRESSEPEAGLGT